MRIALAKLFHFFHVSLGFLERRNATIAAHIAFAGIVGGKNMVEIGKFVFQVGDELGAALNIGTRVKRVADFQVGCGFGHQLHKTLGANP